MVRRLKHRAEYLLLRALESAIRPLTPSLAARLGTILGDLVRWMGIRRAVVEENLRRAFPDADSKWIVATIRESYRHLGREVVAMVRLTSLDPSRVKATVEIPDSSWNAFQSALAEGRGVILATGHYGNWEMAAAGVAARGAPIEAIVKSLSNPLVGGRLEQARHGLGVGTIDVSHAASRVPRAVLSGVSIGIAADQDARDSGVWVPFFGAPASTHRGPALFALRLQAPLFAAVARRLPDGRYHLSGTRIPVEATESLEEDVVRLTSELARHLEREIRKDPSQYFWFHKRWKTPPPQEPVFPEAGITTQRGAPDRV